MTVYGRLSRLTANPTPRIYPPMAKPPDTSPQHRWCFVGRHEVTDPERWPDDRGCSTHPTDLPPLRTINGWRTCGTCHRSRRPSAYLLGYTANGVRVCDSCGAG